MKSYNFQQLKDPVILRNVRQRVLGGAVFACPTDTVYGFSGNFLNPAVHERIDRLKTRSGQPYSAAVSSPEMLRELALDLPEIFLNWESRLLPGPYTILFFAAPSVTKVFSKRYEKIGLRMPDHPELLDLISFLKLPLVTTSANRSGAPMLNDPALIKKNFPDLDFIIDGGIISGSEGSTVIDMVSSPPVCLRRGKGYDFLIENNIIKNVEGRK